MTTQANSMIVTPGTGSCRDIIGTNAMINANMNLQQAFLNLLAEVSDAVTAYAEFQNKASQAMIDQNKALYDKYMAPVIANQKKGGPNWKPSGEDQLNMNMYQTLTQQNNAQNQAINQSVSTGMSAGTNLMQGIQSNSSNFTTMVGDTIDTAIANMRLQ